MSKKNPAKERARARRLKEDRLRAEEFKRKQRGAQSAILDVLYGSPTVQTLAKIGKAVPKAKTPIEWDAECTRRTEGVRHLAARYIEAIEASMAALLRPSGATSGLMFTQGADPHEDPLGVPWSLFHCHELGGDPFSYSAIDLFFKEDHLAMTVAWLVGLELRSATNLYLVLCGTREGARACFAADASEWLPISDPVVMTPAIEISMEAMMEDAHPDTADLALSAVLDGEGRGSEVGRISARELANALRANFATDALVLADLFVYERDSMKAADSEIAEVEAELRATRKALKRKEDELQAALRRLEQKSETTPPGKAAPASAPNVAIAAPVSLTARLRAIF